MIHVSLATLLPSQGEGLRVRNKYVRTDIHKRLLNPDIAGWLRRDLDFTYFPPDTGKFCVERDNGLIRWPGEVTFEVLLPCASYLSAKLFPH